MCPCLGSAQASDRLLEIRPETPVSGRKNLVHVKLVYDDAGLATKPNRVCCNKKYGSRIREIQVTARKPFRARFGRSCGVDRACITGSLVFMAGFCFRWQKTTTKF